MKLKTLEKIALNYNTAIEYKTYMQYQNIPYILNTAIGYFTFDDNGNRTFISDYENFPSKFTSSYIKDSIDANSSDLGFLKVLNWQYLQDKTFVVADIETTGFSPEKGGRIIEIGALKIDENGNVIDKFHEYINPGIKIPEKITNLTGITNDMVKNAKNTGDVLRNFAQFFKGSTMVFHNARFDWDIYLIPFLDKIGLKVPENYPCIDTVDLSKYCFPNEKKHDLETVCNRLGIEVKDHHNAFADVNMTTKMFINMRNQCQEKYSHLPYTVWILNNQNKKQNDIKIYGVRYWGKTKVRSEEHTNWRYYVNFYCNGTGGSAYYDVMTNSWEIKSYPYNLDANELKEPVFKFLSINSYNELKKMR